MQITNVSVPTQVLPSELVPDTVAVMDESVVVTTFVFIVQCQVEEEPIVIATFETTPLIEIVGVGDIDAENCAVMLKDSELFPVLALAGGKLCVNETDGLGQVPHTGVLSLLKGDCDLKLSGKEEIFGTHHPDRS